MAKQLPIELDLVVDPGVFGDEQALLEASARKAGVRPAEIDRVELLRRSVDARRGRVRIHARVRLLPAGALPTLPPEPEALPTLRGPARVAIVGAGPAGSFCALQLARAGIRSVVFERGRPVRTRRRDVARLSRDGVLDPESNYCFGEGGAGTFSDGKLYTRANKRGSVRHVLETFVAHGAAPSLLIEARPHIGTNRLPQVVTAMREHLESAGVQFCFEHRVAGLLREGGKVTGVRLEGRENLAFDAVVLATGHSARDVHRWLAAEDIPMSFKPFAMGIRVEHPQALIDEIQYGTWAGHAALGAASYRLVERVGERSVFSFCMCPGGHMVPATTDVGAVVVNGWSPSSRRGKFANSGFVVEVDADTLRRCGLDPADPLAGLVYQERLEARAYELGGGAYKAPAQRLSDFMRGRISPQLPDCSYPRGVSAAPLHELLRDQVEPLREALTRIESRMPGFAGEDGLAVGVESRTSCPIRVERDGESLESPACAGLYPCAEGAGYAGGIMSAALDGIRVAQRIEQRFSRA
jgi:uncharacterized FAD-dependent dehydrogenase